MKSGITTKIWQIFLLTQLQLVGSLVLAIAVFLIEFSNPIIHILESGSQVTAGLANKTASEYVHSFLQKISELPHTDDIIIILLWALSAITLYLVAISLYNVFISIRNEIVVDVNYSKGSAAKVLASRFGAKALVAGSFVVVCIVSIIWLIPYWMNMLSIFVFSGLDLRNSVFLLVGFLGLMLNIYLIWTAAHFARIYEKSL
jgi:hypothetical protein